MMEIHAGPGTKNIFCGYAGENKTREVIWDLSGWYRKLGGGTAQLLVKRQGDEKPYPAAVRQQEGRVSWIITETETCRTGQGSLQLNWMLGERTIKSAVFGMTIAGGMEEPGPVPPAEKAWTDEIIRAGAQAAEGAGKAAESAEAAKASAAAAAESARQAAQSAGSPSGGGTADHSKLANREKPDQHPMGAITGLAEALAGKLGHSELQAGIDAALAQAAESGAFDGADGRTPEKGVDYWTPEECRSMAKEAAALADIAYPVQEMTAATAEIKPNIFYRWPEMAALTITLAPEKAGVTNEYCGEFVSGTAPTTFAVPDTVKWVQPLNIEAGKTYQFSIIGGIGVIAGA